MGCKFYLGRKILITMLSLKLKLISCYPEAILGNRAVLTYVTYVGKIAYFLNT